MQAIILSGGKGTRLDPLTRITPKPMLPVGKLPHLEHQINLLKKHGITDIIFSTGYLHSQILDYFKDGSEFGVKIQYVEDGEIPLGTGGAIKNALKLVRYENVLILNGDILTDCNLTELMEVHEYMDLPITLALAKVDDPSSYGVAVVKDTGHITKFVEKPQEYVGSHINAGIYIFDKESINSFGIKEEGFSMVETDLFPDYAQTWSIAGYKFDTYWLDIGTHERYAQAWADVTSGKFSL